MEKGGEHELYIRRCLELAVIALGKTAPNPMVGALLVYDGKIIGEGYHEAYGSPHAEMNAINSAGTQFIASLPESTLYVSLEPCSHHGKTPPCTDLILKNNIKKIVIGTADPNKKVSGNGADILRKIGCEVITGVLENECRELNKRFFTFHEQKRPYVILKWAETADRFIGTGFSAPDNKNIQISGNFSRKLVHKWRSEEQAIMVGTDTALTDNPELNVRDWNGMNPLRIVLDRTLRLPSHLNLFDGTQETLVYTAQRAKDKPNLHYITCDFSKNLIHQILHDLFERKIQSIIVEGGTQLLNSFITSGKWDEARIFTSPERLGEGIRSPEIDGKEISSEPIGQDVLRVVKNSTFQSAELPAGA